ncbi:hypothetical protein N8D56_13225 [Devosia sp. A8/3-2]|nr:hypothetical protein N8D56_13225 [Devosia sp. A8/3-2]
MTIDVFARPARAWPVTLRRISSRSGLNTAAGHLLMVLLSIFCLFPVYWMLVSSFRPANTLFETSLWPTQPSLDNYTRAIDAIPIARMLVNTLVFSAVSTIFQLLTGILAAFAFARWKFPFDKLVYTGVALTRLVPFR